MSDDTKNDTAPAPKPGKASAPKPGKDKAAKSSESGAWSTGAKVGAAIGSAAVAAALLYAGRHQMKKHDDFKPAKDKPLPKHENEPDYDDDFIDASEEE